MWAIDANNDGILDTNADSLPDGDIDVNDDSDSNGFLDDDALGTTVALSDIRAVRIWILARSRQAYTKFTDNSIYTLGHKVIDMSDMANTNRNNFRHKMLVGAVALLNHERKP